VDVCNICSYEVKVSGALSVLPLCGLCMENFLCLTMPHSEDV